jgi:WS/DGAT/MGAT family acyltransferase
MVSYARLTALDRFFLDIEDRTTHMHVGATCIFEGNPRNGEGPGVDSDAIRAYVNSRLHLMPRYRQRLARVPFSANPVWIDDESFNIRYHVRHTSLPHPGDERQLKRLVAWINSQQLDRGKPLWEMWIVEGLEGGRFALVNKAHHCMIDGLSGADLLAVLLTAEPQPAIGKIHPWIPTPPPTTVQLARDAIVRRVAMPLEAGRTALTETLRNPIGTVRRLGQAASALTETLAVGMQHALETPFNRRIGSHRRFDWLTVDLDEIKTAKRAVGATVNDVILATVAGATGRFLSRRGVPSSAQEALPFRAFCPVSIRAVGERGQLGNRVSNMIAELPITVREPLDRLARVCQTMTRLKQSQQARGTELFESLSEWTAPSLLSAMVKMLGWMHPYNVVVTNVPGPQFPLYLLGARLVASYPLVPLFAGQGVGIALFSYAGKMCWGFNADRDLMPDLHDYVRAVDASFREIVAATDGRPAAIAARPESTALNARDDRAALRSRGDGR